MDDTTREWIPMIKTLKFERRGVRFQVPEVTVPLNQGWTLKDAGHRAVVDFGELRVNGAMLTERKLQLALKAVVFASAAYSDAGDAYEALVRAETKDGKLSIFTEDLDSKTDVGLRGDLRKAMNVTELLLVALSETFLALYLGREPEDEAFVCFGAVMETFLAVDGKRDVLVS